MKIATYNVNGINGRLPVLIKWLQKSSPDIVCLQELKAPQDKFPITEINDAGYQAIWQGQKSWNGVAILAKNGLELNERRRGLLGDEEDEQSRYIEASVNNMIISCLYVPNGNPTPGPKFEYKLKWLQRLCAHAEMLINLDVPVALIGDYNIIPTERDVYKPEKYANDALFLPEVRKVYQELVDMGWIDMIRALHPDEEIYTFYDYFRNAYARNAGMRIDHFMVNSILKNKVSECGVDKEVRGWEKSSDHCPVWITL